MNPVVYEQIISLLGLIALWAFWYYLWKPQRVDTLRQELFTLRSDLFDLAANGTIPFDHAAYTQLRLLINGLIRFSHRASFFTLLVAWAQSKHAPYDPLNAWRKDVQTLPENARKQLLAVHGSVSDAFIKHLIGGSVVLFVYVALRFLCALTNAFLLLLTGKKDLRNFTVSHVRNKMDWERNQVAKSGTGVIEARVLGEEQHRTGMKRQYAYAH